MVHPHSHFGEGRYDAQEQMIQTLLSEAKAQSLGQ